MSQTAFSKIASFCPEILRDPSTSKSAVAHTIKTYRQLDVVVNHASVQPYTGDIMDVSDEQLKTHSSLKSIHFLYDKGRVALFKIWPLNHLKFHQHMFIWLQTIRHMLLDRYFM